MGSRAYSIYLMFNLITAILQNNTTPHSSAAGAFATIGLLLKHSHGARQAATRGAFLHDLLHNIDTVLDRHPNAGEFMRRTSVGSREPTFAALRANVHVLMQWFGGALSAPHQPEQPSLDANGGQPVQAELDDAALRRLSRTAVRLWPWCAVDARLQLATLQWLTNASENSLPVCQVFALRLPTATAAAAAGPANGAPSVLQLCAELCQAETARPKRPLADLAAFELALRVATNCAAAAEGRQQVLKLRMLDALDRLHPALTKWQRPWPGLALEWLRFYEILTRYADAASAGIR